MCSVDWCGLSWEAFATLVAGLAAVIGASIVGYRQQKILNHQSAIERLKLRSDTFELRWEVYKASADWLLDWYRSGETPSGDLESKFAWSIERAKFLFRPEVSTKLDKWHRLALKHRVLDAQVQRATGPAAEKITLQLMEISDELESAFKKLPELFGEDMRLSEGEGQLPPFSSVERGNDNP